MVFGKWRGDGLLPANARLVVEGITPQGPWRGEVAAESSERPGAAALRHLWARRRIENLSDQEALEGGPRHKEAITGLGLRYGLLTQCTSFIAVDQLVRNADPAGTPTVDQPSPLPEGVSALAIDAEVPSTPEPNRLDGAWRGGIRRGRDRLVAPSRLERAGMTFAIATSRLGHWALRLHAFTPAAWLALQALGTLGSLALGRSPADRRL